MRRCAPHQRRGLLEGAPASRHRVHRRLEEQPPHHVRGLLEVARELRVDVRIVAREARELFLRLLHVIAEEDVVIASERTEQVIGRKHREAVGGQLEVADDARVQQAHDVGEARGPEARHELLRDGRAPEDLAPLEHQHLQARLRKVGPAHESVVAGPDHDDIVCIRHVFTRPWLWRTQPLRPRGRAPGAPGNSRRVSLPDAQARATACGPAAGTPAAPRGRTRARSRSRSSTDGGCQDRSS